MPSRLPVALLAPRYSPCRQYSSAPLRILFCGSDDFSITSLRALNEARHGPHKLIESIHVIHRPPKPAGRGLKMLREVPVQQVAADLSLPSYNVDTFTGWRPPIPIDLIIAVSFGLLIPSRILESSKFGGLNVHPSLLPDLHGPAPIEHAVLKRREFTGVSVQTLHKKHMDRGLVLAQTPPLGIRIPEEIHAAALKQQLAQAGADMLLHVLKTGKYIPPHESAGWYASSKGPVDHAPKVTKQTQFIDFACHTIDDMLSMQRVLDSTWCILPNSDRLVIHRLADTRRTDPIHRPAGIWVQKGCKFPLIRDRKANIAMILESTCAGRPVGQGNARILGILSRLQGEDRMLLPDL